MKITELFESMGSARGMANIKWAKKEMADASHNMNVDGMVDKKYKADDITDEQAKKFVEKMEDVEKQFPEHGDSDEIHAKYEVARDKVIAKILK